MIIQRYLQNRFLVSTITFLILLLAIVVLIVVPSLQEIRVINEQVLEERLRLEKLYVRGQLQKKVRDNYNNIKEDVGFLDEVFLKENQELQYITTLEHFASEQNIDLNITIGEPRRKPQQRFSVLPFTFQITGSWPKIAQWVSDIEQLPYYTNIKEITVSARSEQQSARMATVSISVETYWSISSEL